MQKMLWRSRMSFQKISKITLSISIQIHFIQSISLKSFIIFPLPFLLPIFYYIFFIPSSFFLLSLFPPHPPSHTQANSQYILHIKRSVDLSSFNFGNLIPICCCLETISLSLLHIHYLKRERHECHKILFSSRITGWVTGSSTRVVSHVSRGHCKHHCIGNARYQGGIMWNCYMSSPDQNCDFS